MDSLVPLGGTLLSVLFLVSLTFIIHFSSSPFPFNFRMLHLSSTFCNHAPKEYNGNIILKVRTYLGCTRHAWKEAADFDSKEGNHLPPPFDFLGNCPPEQLSVVTRSSVINLPCVLIRDEHQSVSGGWHFHSPHPLHHAETRMERHGTSPHGTMPISWAYSINPQSKDPLLALATFWHLTRPDGSSSQWWFRFSLLNMSTVIFQIYNAVFKNCICYM